jgi:excisionase family DNA binding protein
MIEMQNPFNERADRKWLTIREAATYIGMSVGFLRKAVRLRTVPHTRIGSKALRFDRDALDQWLAAQSSAEKPIQRING